MLHGTILINITQRSRRGSKADRAVKAGKKRDAEASLDQVHVGTTALENMHSSEYLGAKFQCDGSDEADVLHRMAIAQTTFGSSGPTTDCLGH